MSSRCHICVDPACGGKGGCNCETCTRKATCHRYGGLKPTIRITRKCTQACSHCCFDCDTEATEMMSPETAVKINQFCQANEITRCEIMGGEFFVNPEWEPVLESLCQGMKNVRLVSNGDWAGNTKVATRVISFLKSHPEVHVGISRDRWHTNKQVDAACALLTEAGINHRTPTAEEVKPESIVPVGRSQYDCSNMFAMFGTYCFQNEKRYNFLIDEEGRIYKCSFGTWQYDTIQDYLKGGFAPRFKEFNTKFYGVFISNCSSCQRMEGQAKREGKSCCKK